MKLWRLVFNSLQVLALVGVIAAAIEATIYLPRVGAFAPASTQNAFTEAEFITIVLAAVSVMLTALAIFLAVAGFFGYVQLRASAHKVARETADRVAREVAPPVAAREARAAARAVSPQDPAEISKALIDDTGKPDAK